MDMPKEPVCGICGMPLHVLTGEVVSGEGGAAYVAHLGCTNGSYRNGAPCPKAGQEQAQSVTTYTTL